jgi:hypothetical protein
MLRRRDLRCDETAVIKTKLRRCELRSLQHLAEMLHRILDSPSSDRDWTRRTIAESGAKMETTYMKEKVHERESRSR